MPEPVLVSRPHAERHWRPDRRLGVFETLLVLDGRPVELDAHLARLAASLAELFPKRPAPDLGDELVGHAWGIELGSVRATVAPAGDGELGVEISARKIERGPGPFLSLSESKAPTPPVELRSLGLAGGLGAHKWADRSLLEETQAGLPAGALPLLLDGDGAVLEASRANVFAVRDGDLVTPPADGRILPGVTRARVLEVAAAIGVETREVELSVDDLLAADEVFLTGSVRGIERVSSCNGTRLAGGSVIGDRIAAELRRAWGSGRFG